MAQVVVGIVGAAVGSFFGNPMMGFSIGMTLGGLMFPEDLGIMDQGKLTDARMQGSNQGAPIPKIFGVYRLAGNIIWCSSVRETYTDESEGGGSGGPRVTTRNYHYEQDLAILLCEGEISGIRRIWFNQTVVYDSRGGTEYFDKELVPENVRFYFGDEDQLPDSIIEASIGVGQVPAYRGSSYMVLEKLNLNKYNGSVPNITVELNAGPCNGQVISEWTCATSGLESDEYDFTMLASKTLRGFAIPGRTEGRNILAAIEQPLFYRNIEVDGKMTAKLRGSDSVATIASGEMGANLGNTPLSFTIKTVRQQEIELPYKVTVNYVSENQDFQTFSQQAIKITKNSKQETVIAYNIVFGDSQARRIAETILHTEWIQRVKHETSLGWKYMYLSAADIITVDTPIGARRCEIVDITTALFGPLNFRLIEDEQEVYTQTLVGATGDQNGTVGAAGLPYHFLADINAIYDPDADYVGFYGGATSLSVGWPGAEARSFGNTKDAEGHDVSHLLTYTLPATMGETLSTLGDCPTTCLWDDVNTVDIELYRGTVSSAASDLDVLNGANKIVIGYEILHFKNVEVLSANTFRLSRLLRGKRGTEYATGSHGTGETCVVPTGACQRYNAHSGERGKTIQTRTLEINYAYTVLPDYEDFVIVGRSRMPYSVCHVTSERDGSDNLTIDWVRRVRKNGELIDLIDAPLDENSERYDIVIYSSGTYGVIKRTVNGLTSPQYVYSAADQVSDFGSVQSTVYAIIYQVSEDCGRGFPKRVSV